jgi:hypothetical protein
MGLGLNEEIKRMRQIMSVINEEKSHVSISCPKCGHDWMIDNDDPDPYLCHICGYNKLEGKYELDKLVKRKKESGLKENEEDEDDFDPYGYHDIDDNYGDKRDDLVSVKAKLKSMGVNNGSRIHITHSENLEPKQVNQENDRPKPKGLWYGVGFEWLDFTISDFTSFYDKNKNVSVFEFDVNSANLLRITNFDELTAFDKEYCTSTERYRNPDWVRLAKEYNGIEIAPYIYKGRFEISWYYGWDVASGCIWNPKGLKIKKLM